MKLFGFEIVGLQVLAVKCPKCGYDHAQIVFAPSEKNTPIPFEKEMREAIKETKLEDFLSLPKCDDLHFHCMGCWIRLSHCEKFGKKCKIIRNNKIVVKGEQ